MNGAPLLTPLQADALREVANVGAGHAATALSEMTNSRVHVSVPRLTVAEHGELRPLLRCEDERCMVVAMQVFGDLAGQLALVLPETYARRLAALLLHREPDSTTFDQLTQSALQEAGNVLAGSYLSALSVFTGKVLLISVPTFVVEEPGSAAFLSLTNTSSGSSVALVLETEIRVEELNLQSGCRLLLISRPEFLGALLDALRTGRTR